MAFAIHQHDSAIGIHVSPHPEPPPNKIHVIFDIMGTGSAFS